MDREQPVTPRAPASANQRNREFEHCAQGARAGQTDSVSHAGQTDQAPQTLASATIFRDPITGELTAEPTAAQAQALAEQTATQKLLRGVELDDPVPFQLESGGRGVFVGDRFMSALVVHRHADGTLSFGCEDPHHSSNETKTRKEGTWAAQ